MNINDLVASLIEQTKNNQIQWNLNTTDAKEKARQTFKKDLNVSIILSYFAEHKNTLYFVARYSINNEKPREAILIQSAKYGYFAYIKEFLDDISQFDRLKNIIERNGKEEEEIFDDLISELKEKN